MSYKPTEEHLIAYLYGELPADDMARVKAYLEANPSAKAQLHELNDTRLIFSELEDEEASFPIQLNTEADQKSEWHYWRPFVAIAAGLLLILSFGWLTNFGISYNEDGFRLGYQEEVKGLSQEEVARMIAADRTSTVNDMKEFVNVGRDSIQNELNAINASLDQEQANLIYASEKEDLMDNMILLSESLSDDYREILRQLIVSFSNNIESQRIQDLQNIQTAFSDLEDATINRQFDIEDELVRLSDKIDAVIATMNNNK